MGSISEHPRSILVPSIPVSEIYKFLHPFKYSKVKFRVASLYYRCRGDVRLAMDAIRQKANPDVDEMPTHRSQPPGKSSCAHFLVKLILEDTARRRGKRKSCTDMF